MLIVRLPDYRFIRFNRLALRTNKSYLGMHFGSNQQIKIRSPFISRSFHQNYEGANFGSLLRMRLLFLLHLTQISVNHFSHIFLFGLIF